MKHTLTGLIVLLLLGGAAVALAQVAQPTPGPLAIPQTATPNPFPTEAPPDPRLSVCRAPALEGFAPYIIRPGDRLGDLLAGVANLPVTQIAALNCLDDPTALPVGAVIWLPQTAPLFQDAPRAPVTATDEQARIIELQAGSLTVANQVGTTISWAAEGQAAFFYPCAPHPDADCARPAGAPPLPLTHEVAVGGFRYAGPVRYRLEVVAGETRAVEDVSLRVTCAQRSLAPISGFMHCPQNPPLVVFGTWQPFENGAMLWFSDTREIWVMTADDKRVQVFNDIYREGAPEPDIEPPEGLFTPERGFGLIWEFIGGPQSVLGWGVAPSRGTDFARQDGGQLSFTRYIGGPEDIVYAVTIIPGTEASFWIQVAGSVDAMD